jgi:hypothetical protein
VIPEQVGVAHISLQHVHGLVPRHVPHLEHRCAAAGRAGQEAGPPRMSAEVGCLDADPLGVGLADLANALIGEPLGAEYVAGADDPTTMAFLIGL